MVAKHVGLMFLSVSSDSSQTKNKALNKKLIF
jgi:hypothetical protein